MLRPLCLSSGAFLWRERLTGRWSNPLLIGVSIRDEEEARSGAETSQKSSRAPELALALQCVKSLWSWPELSLHTSLRLWAAMSCVSLSRPTALEPASA